MDKNELITAVISAAGSLKSVWIVKAAAAFIVAVVCSLHTQLLILFAALVVIDLATKWIALSRQYLIDNQAECPDFLACLESMRAARKAGYIRSSEMKHRFAGKIFVYMLLTLVAALVDLVMKGMDKPEFLAVLVVSYLAVTEMLSIVDNLQAAGVDEAAKLHDLIDKKGSTKL